MTRPTLVVGNWKMNHHTSEIKTFFETFQSLGNLPSGEYWIAPTAIHLSTAISLNAESNNKIKIGAQNCHFEDKGAFTGEISASALKELGADFVILGHSERRSIFNESDEFINKKLLQVLDRELTPILCIGETLAEREAEKTFEVLASQLKGSLANTGNHKQISKLVLAYEPVWAIGTGVVASPEQAEEAHQFVRNWLAENGFQADTTPILYGGSVKPENAEGLFGKNNIDGGLVGGASLKGESFFQLCNQSTS